MEAALSWLITSHNNDEVLIKKLLPWQQSYHNMSATDIGRHLKFFKNFYFSKNAANFLEISRKHVSTASIKNIGKNRVEKKKLKQILPKSYSFRFQTLICIINYT